MCETIIISFKSESNMFMLMVTKTYRNIKIFIRKKNTKFMRVITSL